jgi:hypothetical protein
MFQTMCWKIKGWCQKWEDCQSFWFFFFIEFLEKGEVFFLDLSMGFILLVISCLEGLGWHCVPWYFGPILSHCGSNFLYANKQFCVTLSN